MTKLEKNLHHLFKNVIMMSGTPDWVQQDITFKNQENECKCSPKLAMENGWICKPVLNLVNCSDEDWPAAVKAVFLREMEIYNESGKLFRPTILVNCGSIDEVARLRNKPWFKDNAGKLFHLISIHSHKLVTDDKTNIKQDLKAEIDGKQVEAEEAYNAIMDIDKCLDDLPVIVFQVAMIGEGINVKSFNAVITASNCDKTAMQQIGRAIRNFSVRKTHDVQVEKEIEELQKVKEVETEKVFLFLKRKKVVEKMKPVKVKKTSIVQQTETFTKVENGHANVYVINDNLKTLTKLVEGLGAYDLTHDCFSWGQKIDISTGSLPEERERADYSKMTADKWNDISIKLPEIKKVMDLARKHMQTSCFNSFFSGREDNDNNGTPDNIEFNELIKRKELEGWTCVWTGCKEKDKKHVDPIDIMQKFRERIMKCLDGKFFNELWMKHREAAFLYVVQDEETAKFLDTHLSQKTLDTFTM
jgi:hypothetical protein